MHLIAANNDGADESGCRSLMQMATNIMEMRQKGTSLDVTLRGIDILAKETKNPNIVKPLRQITMDAYSQKKYSSKEIQEQEVNEFAAKYYLNCMKGLGLN